MANPYPEKFSRVEVELKEGEFKEFDVKAGSGLLRHITEEAGRTGTLVLLCGQSCHAIPMANIVCITFTEFNSEAERDAEKGVLRK